MSAWIWPLLAVYALGYVVDWRKAVYRVAWKEAREWDHPDQLDGWNVAAAMFVATLHALIWPIFLLAFVTVSRDPETFIRRVGSEPKSDRIRRLEREADERARLVERLERELGIR